MEEASVENKGIFTHDELVKLFPLIDKQTFEHVFSLFDFGSGDVDPKDFVLTMSLMAIPVKNVELEAVLMFTIFDPDGNGELDREEFSSLMKATIQSKMTHVEFLMKNDAAGKVFEKHMAKEFTEENATFYSAVEQWKQIELPSIDETRAIIEKHIRPGCELEVNIPATQVEIILEAFKEAEDNKLLVPKTIFDEAHAEIYKLMDRDSYARFKKNPEEVKQLTNALFDQADVNGDGVIELEEYKAWVKRNPDAMNFVRELHTTSQKAVSKVRNSVYFKRVSKIDVVNKDDMKLLQRRFSTMEETKEGEEDEEAS